MNDTNVTTISKTCPMDGKVTEVKMTTSDYQRWRAGELLQRAAPEMPAVARETLISGFCAECQGPIFQPPTDEES
jgi:hypothetical protein